VNDRIREAADRVERLAPLNDKFREPGAPGRRFFTLNATSATSCASSGAPSSPSSCVAVRRD
jgi:hypothetical protein